MPKSRRVLLVVIDLLTLVLILFLVIYLSVNPMAHPSGLPHEQLVAKLNGISDPAKLRSLILRDDEYIEHLETLIPQGMMAARSVFGGLGFLAGLNLVVLALPQRPKP